MERPFENGRLVILLKGKYAGRKAVIIDKNEISDMKRTESYIKIVGIKNFPKKINRNMKNEVKKKKCIVKPFTKVINKKHIFLTRYSLEGVNKLQELDANNLKSNLDYSTLEHNKKKLKSLEGFFTDLYLSGKNNWFFRKLKF